MSYYPQAPRERTLDELRRDDEARRRTERREDVEEVYAAHVGEPWACRDQPIPGCVVTPLDDEETERRVIALSEHEDETRDEMSRLIDEADWGEEDDDENHTD